MRRIRSLLVANTCRYPCSNVVIHKNSLFDVGDVTVGSVAECVLQQDGRQRNLLFQSIRGIGKPHRIAIADYLYNTAKVSLIIVMLLFVNPLY